MTREETPDGAAVPRLRYLKDRSFANAQSLSRQLKLSMQEDEEEKVDDIDLKNNEVTEPTAQKGWWSNDAVIASLPDDKLSLAIERYRGILDICLAERLRRSQTPTASASKRSFSSTRSVSEFDITEGRRVWRRVPTGELKPASPQRRRSRGSGSRKASSMQSKLTFEQTLEALKMLNDIVKKKDETEK